MTRRITDRQRLDFLQVNHWCFYKRDSVQLYWKDSAYVTASVRATIDATMRESRRAERRRRAKK